MLYEPHYFFFPPLDKTVARKAIPDLEDDAFENVYSKWFEWYKHNSHLYHQDELHRHLDFLYQMFLKARGLPEWSSLVGSGKEEEFSRFLDSRGYTKHRELYEEWDNASPNPALEAGPSSMESMLISFLERWPATNNGRISRSHILIPLWFNSLIQNDPDKQAALRKMSYERYLLTPHWYYVRALTTIVFRARCLGKTCPSIGRGLWASEAPYRHVHHISYENRGNERFGDVCVLCDQCHQALHKGDNGILGEDSIKDFLNSIWL